MIVKRPLPLAAGVLVLAGSVGSGCSSSDDTAIQLRLSDGADTATTTFEAEDPRTHTQTIEIEIQPVDSDVTLEFQTAGGSTLSIVPASDCESDDGRTTCTVRFPLLEAQSGGEWEAIASKDDGPPATIKFAITWETP